MVIDTDILIDLEHGKAAWLDKVLQDQQGMIVVVPTIVEAEYWSAQQFDKKQESQDAKKVLSLLIKQDLTEPIAMMVGETLRHRAFVSGASVADVIVGCTAVYLDAPLATRNKKHFAKIPSLKFYEFENDLPDNY